MKRVVLFFGVFLFYWFGMAAAVENVPTGNDLFMYEPVAVPNSACLQFSECRPIGSGSGESLSFRISLPTFPAPVDVYIGILAPHLSPDLIMLGQDGNVHMAPDSTSPEFVAWKKGLYFMDEISVFEIPKSQIPNGEYVFFVIVTPGGTLQKFAIWATRVNITGNAAPPVTSTPPQTPAPTPEPPSATPPPATTPSGPPPMPAEVRAFVEDITSARPVRILWTYSGAERYKIYRDGVLVGTTKHAFFDDQKVSAHEQYCYRVSAENSAGLESAQSEPACVAIQRCTDHMFQKTTLNTYTFSAFCQQWDNVGYMYFRMVSADTLELTIFGSSSGQLFGAGIYLAYDASKFQFLEFKKGPLLSNGAETTALAKDLPLLESAGKTVFKKSCYNPDKWRAIVIGESRMGRDPGTPGNNALFVITFKVMQRGPAEFIFGGEKFYQKSGVEAPVTLETCLPNMVDISL